MEDASESAAAGRKRCSAADVEALLCHDAAIAKRPRMESFESSPTHLSLLDEFCDLEGEDVESRLEPASMDSGAQERLVAEMMKSLQKVIGEGEVRGASEPSTSEPLLENVQSPALASASLSELTWADDESAAICGPDAECADRDLKGCEDTLIAEDDRIQLLLQASDDELGIPSSSAWYDANDDHVSFQEGWASLMDASEGLPSAVSGFNWLDAPLSHLEDSRDLFEPIVLF